MGCISQYLLSKTTGGKLTLHCNHRMKAKNLHGEFQSQRADKEGHALHASGNLYPTRRTGWSNFIWRGVGV